MLAKSDDNNDFLNKVTSSDETILHVNGTVKRHNCQIWGSQPPHALNINVIRQKERLMRPYVLQKYRSLHFLLNEL